jgi:hypothetical protein
MCRKTITKFFCTVETSNGARNIFKKNVVPEKMLLALRDPSTAEMSSSVI